MGLGYSINLSGESGMMKSLRRCSMSAFISGLFFGILFARFIKILKVHHNFRHYLPPFSIRTAFFLKFLLMWCQFLTIIVVGQHICVNNKDVCDDTERERHESYLEIPGNYRFRTSIGICRKIKRPQSGFEFHFWPEQYDRHALFLHRLFNLYQIYHWKKEWPSWINSILHNRKNIKHDEYPALFSEHRHLNIKQKNRLNFFYRNHCTVACWFFRLF